MKNTRTPHPTRSLLGMLRALGCMVTLALHSNYSIQCADLNLQIEQSIDLKNWTPIRVDPNAVTAGGQVKTSTENPTGFLRLVVKPAGIEDADEARIINVPNAKLPWLNSRRTITAEIRKDGNLYLDDIVLGTVDELQSTEPIDESPESNRPELHSAGTFFAGKWARGIVPVEFGSGIGMAQIDVLEEAMREIMQSSPVRFVPRSDQQDWIRFELDSEACGGIGCGCSPVGRKGGRQVVAFPTASCFTKSTVIHELMHSLGFIHEQCRSDRDAFVRIVEENIRENALFNFDKDMFSDSKRFTPYDFASIMHYGLYAFGKTGSDGKRLQTIRPRVAVPIGLVVGSATGLSRGDIEGLNELYPSGSDVPIQPIGRDSMIVSVSASKGIQHSSFFVAAGDRIQFVVDANDLWNGGGDTGVTTANGRAAGPLDFGRPEESHPWMALIAQLYKGSGASDKVSRSASVKIRPGTHTIRFTQSGYLAFYSNDGWREDNAGSIRVDIHRLP